MDDVTSQEPRVHRLTAWSDVKQAYMSRDLRQKGPAPWDKDNIPEGFINQLHGEEHKARRKAENPLFHRDVLRHYETVLFPRIIDRHLDEVAGGEEVDLVWLGIFFSVTLAARSAGIDLDETSREDAERLAEYVRKFAEGMRIHHTTRDKEELKAETRAALADFDRDFFGASRRRREELLAHPDRIEEEPRDILTLLLRRRDELGLDDGLILRETAGYLMAGAGTTTIAVSVIVDRLFGWLERHPEDRDRLCHDVRFAQRCVHEALRVQPVTHEMTRVAERDMVIGEHHIAAGDVVAIQNPDANRDRSFFGEDADQFDPHRVLPPGAPPFGISFGAGMHACIGRIQAAGEVPHGPVGQGEGHESSQLVGLLTVLIQRLFQRGIAPHPEKAPEFDRHTERTHWSRYPVVFR